MSAAAESDTVLSLPSGMPAPPAEAEEELPAVAAVRSTIVCADDDPQELERLRRLLSEEGFEVFACPSAPATLECIWERLPDVLIVEPMMASMAGVALCRQLRAHPETERLPIVLHTARSIPADTGWYDCVCAKPAERSALLLVVRTLLMERP